MKTYLTVEEAREELRQKASIRFNEILEEKGLDKNTLDQLEISELASKKTHLRRLKNSQSFTGQNAIRFEEGINYLVKEAFEDRPRKIVGFAFSIIELIDENINFINLKLKEVEHSKITNTINGIINEIQDPNLRTKLDEEFSQLKEQSKRIEDILTQEDSRKSSFAEQIELRKSEVDLLGQKSEVYLRFLNRESIASIIGSILLLLMGLSLLVMMFLQKEPIQIVQSAFLLILGYFFGHSKNKQ